MSFMECIRNQEGLGQLKFFQTIWQYSVYIWIGTERTLTRTCKKKKSHQLQKRDRGGEG